MKDQRKEAIKLAQTRANEKQIGVYVYLIQRTDKVGTVVALDYFVVREDMEQPQGSELIAYLIPE